MSTATLEAHHRLRGQLSAESIDVANGIIRGATVAKAGVQATGKFYTAPDGREYPVFTDETTLSTLLAAAQDAGKRIKVREDHLDEPGARAGYSFEFKHTDDGRVIADIQLFKSYENRSLMLETAIETPEEIGLSIDFLPSFEVRDGKAYLRVDELNAVDIVDEGAITPGGLFLSAGVDTTTKVEPTRAKMPSPTSEELMSAIGTLTETVGKLATSLSETQAAVTKLSTVKPEEKPADKSAETAGAVKELSEKFSALQAQLVQFKREKALLGFRGSSEERAQLATAQPEEIEAAAAKKKTYLQLVAERTSVELAANNPKPKTAAHDYVRRNHYAEYEAHLSGKGVYDPSNSRMRLATRN
jgi:hypothetical protein